MERWNRLGAFRVEGLLGRGGMGEVWAARHDTGGAPVAIKVLSGVEGASAQLEEEIAAVASIDHPGVVRVLDRGRLDRPLGGAMPGAPWFAMERADATVAERPPTTWDGLWWLLDRLLDALGVVHGAGILHRDIKPSNLLRVGTAVRLADFGLATRTADGGPRMGSEGFMPPEQRGGWWEDQGPWTDLFAVGVCARLLAGADVPPGLAAWIRTATSPEVERRFRSAAEARLALSWVRGDEGALRPSVVVPPTVPASVEVPVVEACDAVVHPVPELPEDPPRRPNRYTPPGVGLGLLGLRTVPMLGRGEERHAAWAVLRAVVASGSPGALLLHGDSGVGKTRMAEWLATEAHAAIGAQVWRVVYEPEEVDALGRGLAGVMRVRDLTGVARSRRIRRWARWSGMDEPWFVEAAAEWVTGARPRDAPTLMGRLASWAASTRPVVLVLDDAQWADPTEIRDLGQALAGPVVVVATSRVTVELGLPATAIGLGPLDPASLRAYLEGQVGLRPEVTARIVERSGNNPMVAVQLLKELQSRGDLAVGAGGVSLAPGRDVVLPGDAVAAWRGQVAQRLGGLATSDRDAVELAAALGGAFDVSWWRAMASPSPSLLADRVRDQWWRLDGGRVRWAHAALRTAVLAAAHAGGRLAGHHGRVATWLRGRDDADAAVLGRHLLRAGRRRDAAPFLAMGARARFDAGLLVEAERLLDELEVALTEVPEDDPLHGCLLLERGRLAWIRGRHGLASTLAAALRERIARFGLTSLVPRSEWLAAALAAEADRGEDVLAHVSRALAHRDVDRGLRIRLLRLRGAGHRLLGDRAAAVAALQAALGEAASLGDRVAEGDIRNSLAVTAHVAGHLDAAERHYAEAARLYEQTRVVQALTGVYSNLGDLYRHRGEVRAARDAYERSLHYHAIVGSAAGIVTLNLALTDLAAGDVDAAGARLRHVIASAGGDRPAWVGLAHQFLLPILAGDAARARGWTERAAVVEAVAEAVRVRLGGVATA